MEEEKVGIDCSMFRSAEEVMKRLTREINEAQDIETKVAKAQALIDETGLILSCDEYDVNSMDCRNCRAITDIRKYAAEIIKKAQRLA